MSRFRIDTKTELEARMPSITLKGLPDELYDALRRRAATNRRSLNGEILHTLERAVARDAGPAVDETLARLDALRTHLAREGVRLDAALVDRARRERRT